MKDLPDEIVLWQEKEAVEHPQVDHEDNFVGATTFKDYEEANPDRVGGEVIVSVKLD